MSNFFSKIKEKIAPLFGIFENILTALAQSIAENGGRILIAAAKEAVESAENTQGTGEDKRKAAIAAIIHVLESQGIPIAMNAINGAIEAAVAQEKLKKLGK